ncbi:flagellar protein export ATPase FliI [Lyticum sinuosum]|uniref:Flagellum-specific ATP synthase n=1 Tax=Lyticum sinuosum TaxID=1332059 RepID=A0AAE4VKS0_9RICK|nr:flagellar protein export ATPase FliI [Lyticum sinuosum]MDZ5761084.1 Flagellar protein export ATPase FliI [Lyticum sinuosum]
MSKNITYNKIDKIINQVNLIKPVLYFGYVKSVKGLLIEVVGLEKKATIGSCCQIKNRDNKIIDAEVIGINNETTLLIPLQNTIGIAAGCEVMLIGESHIIYPDISWLGRVINALGHPIDGKGPLLAGTQPYSIHNTPPPAHTRMRVGSKVDMGIRTINTFLSCCIGQRMGIFAGSGVGKSMMLAMIAKFAKVDVKIIGLIGERGREVQEFIEDYLGPTGLARSIVIVATSDESAILRRQAAYTSLALAEYFRDQDMHVLCMLDSLTRFAMAQRDIGLASGEPPTTRGYTPSVFNELPKLLERAGPGVNGYITGLFSVLVEGGDMDEPIADAVRGILDGHIILKRKIASRGIYPAIDILESISRMIPRCNTPKENKLIEIAKNYLSIYTDMEDMIRIGAYKKGSDKDVDTSIKYYESLSKFMTQAPDDYNSLQESYNLLAKSIEYDEFFV